MSTRRKNRKTLFDTTRSYVVSSYNIRIRSMLYDRSHKILLYWLRLPVVLAWETYLICIVKRSEKCQFTV